VSTIKVKENKPDFFKLKKVYAKDEKVELKTDRARFTKDDEQKDLDEKTEVIDAYRYGSTYIPIDNPETLKYPNEKCFTLLGFTKAENIKPCYYLGDSANEIMPDLQKCDADQEVAFASIVDAMHQENVYGIVRRVFSKASSPRMGCLVPYHNDKTKCLSLMYYDLPFEDDIRKYTLENFCAMKKFKPIESQLKLVDDLIEQMDLTAKGNESYEPKLTFSPYIQRMFQTLAARAVDPDGPLPNFDSHLTNSLVKKAFDDSTRAVLKRLNSEFYTRNIDNKKLKLDETKNLFSTDESKKPDQVEYKETDASIDLNGIEGMYASVQSNKIRKVGTINPVKDFNALLSSIDPSDYAEFLQICDQIMTLIREFIVESTHIAEAPNVYHSKSLDCLKSLREACLANSHVDVYNQFLAKLKVQFFESNENSSSKFRQDKFLYFWRYLFVESGVKLALITTTDHQSSTFSATEAERFVREPLEIVTNQNQVNAADQNDNVEDLFDLM
jgi:ATP-dependent DNA helicase 2 subunit 2